MSLKTKLRTLAASAALIGLGATSLSAAESKCEDDQRPFNGTFEITERIQFLMSPQGICAAFGTIDGRGTTTFGPASVNTVDCITPVPGTPTNIFNSTNLKFVIGSETLRAAYGGQATAVSMLDSAPNLPAKLSIIGGLTFTGGTGRFANAKGTAVVTGSETFVAPGSEPGVALYSGAITVSGCIGAVR